MTTTTRNTPVPSTPYRLPGEAHLGRVSLQVSNLAASVSYYTRVLGLRLLSNQVAAARLGAADGTVLVELHERPGAPPVPRGGRIGLYHFAILLPDRASLGRFVAYLGDIGAYAGSADHLVSEALYLSDPDGLGIEVYADRPRSTWTMNGGEIAMTTKPLDLRALVRAAAGQAWDGMPAGTRIGHVHFHVGTLEAAEAFYDGALGFDTVVRSYSGALFFSAGGYHHHVGANTWAGAASLARPDEARLIEWELVLPANHDLSAAAASAAAAGYDVRTDGDSLLITDSSGVTVRLTDQKEQL